MDDDNSARTASAFEDDRAAAETNLQIPEWVPDSIKRKARELHQLHSKSPISVALIKRLATDPKMKRVWDQFRRRSRNLEDYQQAGPRYKLAKRFDSPGLDEQTVIADLFEQMVTSGRASLHQPSPDGADAFRKKAEALRADAGRLEKMRPRREGQKYAQHLRKAAEVYDVIKYKPQDQAEGLACNIASYFAFVFESPKQKITAMHKTTAAITGVITEREITSDMVHNWLRKLKRPRHR